MEEPQEKCCPLDHRADHNLSWVSPQKPLSLESPCLSDVFPRPISLLSAQPSLEELCLKEDSLGVSWEPVQH